MSPLSKLLKRGSKPKAGQLYGATVAQARQPAFYTTIGADDTPDGRFAMISLHVLLILERLSAPDSGLDRADVANQHPDKAAGLSRANADLDPELGRALMEVFVEDLDQSMRELGIGDMGVPKRAKKAMAQFYDYARRYRSLQYDDGAESLHALLCDMIPGLKAGDPGVKLLAAYVRDVEHILANQTARNLRVGSIKFPNIDVLAPRGDRTPGGGAV